MKKLLSALLVIMVIMSTITIPVSAEALTSVAWQSITTAGNTVLAVTTDGAVYGWGLNSTGALGDGTTVDKILPAQVAGTHHWNVLSTGGTHTVAIKDDGTLWAWGRNWYGQLGDGTTESKTSPVQIGTDNDWVSVSAGGDHTLAIKSNGDLYSWGSGFYGQLGLGIDGNTADRYTPQLVSSSQDWIYILARGGNSFAIMSDGSLWGCGENHEYVLGLGDNARRKTFTRIGTASDWSALSSRGSHTMALKSNGELWGWGNNSYGQLGNGSNASQTAPIRIGSDSDWTEISCGDSHTVARKSDRSIWTMGWNLEGQLGSSDETDSNVPIRVGTDSNWVSVKAGANHNVAIKADGTLWSWGRSDGYQLGLGTKTSRHFPVKVTGATTPIAVVSTSPADLATGVAADATVSVTFEDWVQDGVNASLIIMNDSAGNRVDYTRTINGRTVTINRRGLLPNNTTYTVSFPNEGMQDVPAFSLSFSTGAAPFNFKRYAYHTVGYYPTRLTAGDFNKDGKKDIAAVNELDHHISIALGNGDGTFQPSVNIGYLLNSRPSGIKAADINGDGNEDLVVVRHLNNTVAVFAGNGDGTFQSPATYSTGTRPLMPVTGDWDGDGDTDLAVVNRDSHNVSVYFNNGGGTFGPAANYAAGSYPYWVTAADLNGDNNPDLLTANNSSADVSVFINKGDGTYHTAVNYAAGSNPCCVAVGDLNNDNIPDLAVIRDANFVSTLMGNGDGTFQAYTNHAIPASSSPSSGTVADVNGDGKNDLVIAGEGNDTVIVRLGIGDGTFQNAVSFLAGSSPYMVLAEDVNGDAKPDLVTTANGYSRIAILLNDSPDSSIERVSVASDGTEGNGWSDEPSVTPDGKYVAFSSSAFNSIPGDNTSHIYVHDRQTGNTTRVSVDSAGTEATGDSFSPDISDNGRYVTFHSDATNLVSADSNGAADIFVHDIQTGLTTRVSVSSSGVEANLQSIKPVISGDGMYVVFQSDAFNLVDAKTGGIYLHNRTTGETTWVGADREPAISENGRYIAFNANIPLLPADSNGLRDIYVYDMHSAQYELVSIAEGGESADSVSSEPAISSDGRYIAFASDATNLVAGDTNNLGDIFVRDRQSGSVQRVSLSSTGAEADDSCYNPSISPDGRYVSFTTFSRLVPEDTNMAEDIYVYDRIAGSLSVATLGNGNSYSSALANQSVAFVSSSSNLVDGDTNGNDDIFIRTLEATLPDMTPPAWISGSLIASNISQTGLTLTWSGALDNTAVTGYRLYKDGALYASLGDVLTANVSGLAPGTSYTFKVEGGDAGGNWSTNGPTVTVTTATLPDTTPPEWISGSLTASSIGQTGLTLTWTGALDNSAVTGYRLYKDGTLFASLGNVLTANVSGLAPGTSYTFKVEGCDAAGNSSTNGPELTVTTLAAVQTSTGGDMPYLITATDVQGSSSLTYEKYFALAGKLITIDNSALRKMDNLNRKVAVVTPVATVILTPALAKEVLTSETGAKVVLSITSVPDSTVVIPGNLHQAGKVVEIIAKVSTSAGEQNLVGEMDLLIPYEQQNVQRVDRLGIYRLESDGLRYVGGITDASTHTVKAKVNHFSRYCVMEDARTFSDLEEHWSKTDVERLLSRYIVYGNPDGSYAPNKPVTRGEFAALLARVVEFSGATLSSDSEVQLRDVPDAAWYKDAVTKMAQSGIINGYSDGTFRAHQVITREEMAAMLVRMVALLNLKLPDDTANLVDEFHDYGEISPWAEQSLVDAVALGLFKGTGTGHLEPKGISTRGAAAAVISRLLVLADLI